MPMLSQPSVAAGFVFLAAIRAQASHAPLPPRVSELGAHVVRALELADLDRDGTPEIILGTDAGSKVWRRYQRRYVQVGPPVGREVDFLQAWDRDGDGDLDLLQRSLGKLEWLVNDGAGNVRPVPLPGVPQAIDKDVLLGDLGGTPEPEIVLAHTTGAAIYSPDSRNQYVQSSISWPLFGTVYATMLADLDADGNLDFVLRGAGWVAFGIHAGTHWKWTRIPFVAGLGLRAVLRDLDRNGRPELVIATERGIESLTLGTQGIQRRLLHMSPKLQLEVLDAVDLDGDRILDLLAVRNGYPSTDVVLPSVLPLLQDATGSFRVGNLDQPTLQKLVGIDALSRSGDLDGDGDEDWILCRLNPKSVGVPFPVTPRIFLREQGRLVESTGDPHGALGDGDEGVGDTTGQLSCLADLDQDGLPELVNSDGLVMSLDGAGRIQLRRLDILKGTGMRSVLPMRLDSDPAPDLVALDGGSVLRTWLNDGKGAFHPKAAIAVQHGSHWIHSAPVGDLDGDGDDDLIVPAAFGPCLALLSDGRGSFVPAPKLLPDVPETPYSMQLRDLDRDGDPDLVIAMLTTTPGTKPLRILQNQRGLFRDVTERVLPAPSAPTFLFQEVQIADFDRDGHQDIVTCTSGSGLRWLRGSASGVFSQAAQIALPHDIPRMLVCDLDHDAVPDLLVGGGSGVSIYRFQGGAFHLSSRLFDLDQRRAAYPLAHVDWDGDGDADILLEEGYPSDVRKFHVFYGRERHLWSGVTPRAGSRWGVVFDAEPGYATAPRLVIPIFGTKLTQVPIAPLGTLRVDSHGSVVLSPRSVPAPQGRVQLGLDVPPLPALVGARFHAQALVVDLVAGAHFTNVLSERIR